ncbi:MAG: hypothetical protein Q8O46_00320 [bacterium]|nr:hypothetical protein [bacterium]
MAIIISKDGKNAKKVDKSAFEKEDYLQDYIQNNPESIPVYEIEEDKRLFIITREFLTESGPIDALAVDKDGDIYIVETKLYKNPDKRMVVAQALDYGAALWKHLGDFSEFAHRLDEEMQNKFKINFQQKVADFFEIGEDESTALLESMRRNLYEGNLKFVILMDEINERLKDLIIYVNQNSQFDIYAVQLEYYKFDAYEIMIPKLFGVEVKKNVSIGSTGSPRKKWIKEDFLPVAQKQLNEPQYKTVEKIFRFCEQYANDITMGTGAETASANVKFNKFSNERAVFCLKSNGRLGFSLNWVAKKGVNDQQKNLLEKLKEKLKSIEINIVDIDTYTSTWLSVEEVTKKADDIIKVITDLIV